MPLILIFMVTPLTKTVYFSHKKVFLCGLVMLNYIYIVCFLYRDHNYFLNEKELTFRKYVAVSIC